MVQQLPIVKIDGKHYFVDERLQEYRQTTNPHNRIAFEDMGERRAEPVEMKKNLSQGKKNRIR